MCCCTKATRHTFVYLAVMTDLHKECLQTGSYSLILSSLINSCYCHGIIFFPSIIHNVMQVGLEKPEEPDISLASNLERQLLYLARPSLLDNKPVRIHHKINMISHGLIIITLNNI